MKTDIVETAKLDLDLTTISDALISKKYLETELPKLAQHQSLRLIVPEGRDWKRVLGAVKSQLTRSGLGERYTVAMTKDRKALAISPGKK